MVKIAYSQKLGRTIRQEPPPELGIATQTLLERALAAGRWQEADDLAVYMRQELAIMSDILQVWIRDIVTSLMERRGDASPAALAQALTGSFDSTRLQLGEGTLRQLRAAITRQEAEAATRLAERLRQEFKGPHDAMVVWVQDLLTFIAREYGEEAVAETVLHANQHIWAPRYELWERMTPEEKLQLTVEGMRGRLSGPGRRGDVIIREEEDRYVIAFDPCGSGGVMRRGDPETGGLPLLVPGGTNQQPHPWTWGKTGVHWYCTHCCIIMEWASIQDRGYPFRPLAHTLDHSQPCVWYIYKRPELTRPEHYLNVGAQPPSRR